MNASRTTDELVIDLTAELARATASPAASWNDVILTSEFADLITTADALEAVWRVWDQHPRNEDAARALEMAIGRAAGELDITATALRIAVCKLRHAGFSRAGAIERAVEGFMAERARQERGDLLYSLLRDATEAELVTA